MATRCVIAANLVQTNLKRAQNVSRYYLSFQNDLANPKSVFSHIPTHYMSIFLMPEKMIHKVINWKVVSCSQEDGGLSVDGATLKKCNLLAKWGWRFINEKNSLWAKVVKSIHGES